MPSKYQAFHNSLTRPTNSNFSAAFPPSHVNKTKTAVKKKFGWTHFLGEGQFGFTLKVPGADVKMLPRRLVYKKVWKMPRANQDIVIKVIVPPVQTNKTSKDLYLKNCLREMYMHGGLYYARPACKIVGKDKFCPRDVVPAIYFGGFDTELGCFFLCMEYVSGIPVNRLSTREGAAEYRHLLTPQGYRAVEKGLLTLWLYGVSHHDFHSNNVMIDPATGKIKILDFGKSSRLLDFFYGDVVMYNAFLTWLRRFIREDWSTTSLVNYQKQFTGKKGQKNFNMFNHIYKFIDNVNRKYDDYLTSNFYALMDLRGVFANVQ